MTTTPRTIADLDVPLAQVAAEVKARATEQRCQILIDAAEHSHSPSDRIAFALDAWLIRHPEACSTDADYPGWAEHIAALAKLNRTKGDR